MFDELFEVFMNINEDEIYILFLWSEKKKIRILFIFQSNQAMFPKNILSTWYAFKIWNADSKLSIKFYAIRVKLLQKYKILESMSYYLIIWSRY